MREIRMIVIGAVTGEEAMTEEKVWTLPEDPSDEEILEAGKAAGAWLHEKADEFLEGLTDEEPTPRRNVHCSNCGDTRGGPVGHEISECTWKGP